MIVSQSLAESRQTIHRRRAETSSLERLQPSAKPSPVLFQPRWKRRQKLNRSTFSTRVCFIPRVSVSFSISVSSHLYPLPRFPPRRSPFDDEIAELADNTDWKKGSHTKSNFQLRAPHQYIARTPRYRLLWSPCIYSPFRYETPCDHPKTCQKLRLWNESDLGFWYFNRNYNYSVLWRIILMQRWKMLLISET